MLRVDRRLLAMFAASTLVAATVLEACVIQPQPIPPLEGNEDNGPERPVPGDSAGAPTSPGNSGGSTSGSTAGTTGGAGDAAAPSDGGRLDGGADAGDGDAGDGDAGDGDAGGVSDGG